MNLGILKPATNVLDMYIYNTFMILHNTSISSAAGLIKAVFGFCLIMLTNHIVNRINPDNALI
jgi:putative aldouronate transport system permease protein